MPHEIINSVRLYHERSGRGEALVFLHGYTGSTRDWDRQIPVFSNQYTVIAADHRGHGKSEAPSTEDGYSIYQFADDVYSLLKKLKISRCCLIGHSMGGFISLQLALDHPEMVSALVLVDTSSGEWEVAPDYAQLRATLDELARTKGMEAAFEYDATHNPSRIERFKKHPEQREIAKRKVMGTSVDGYIFVSGSFGKWKPVTSRLSEITVPTLIFWGEEDLPFLNAAQILKTHILHSQLVQIPGVGHSPHEEAPDLFNETLMTFLNRSL